MNSKQPLMSTRDKYISLSVLTGLVLPVPVIGEIALGYGIYRLLDDKTLGNISRGITSGAIATIARAPLYTAAYLPMLEGIRSLF